MQFLTKIKVGETEVQISGNVESQQKLVEDLSFFSSIPTVGPNGETDLRFQYRKTQQGYEYYSIVSDKAGMEFKFGQSKQEPGKLFSKGWEPKYVAEEGTSTEGAGFAAPAGGFQAQAAPAANQNVNLGAQAQTVVPTPAQAPAPAQVAPTPATPAAPAVTPQQAQANQAGASDVLSKFGIS